MNTWYEGANSDHLNNGLLESSVSDSERNWLRWANAAEGQLGHSLDGDDSVSAVANGTADGYSLDGAYEAFKAGMSVDEYVALVRIRKATLPGAQS